MTFDRRTSESQPPDECRTVDLGDAAVELAIAGYEVFPCRGKIPAIANPHPVGSDARAKCKGECGRDGHGVHDASAAVEKVAAWWERLPSANIGGRVPPGVAVLDVDPRSGGLSALDELEKRFGGFQTRTSVSGRDDGGRHFWFSHPGGKLGVKRLREEHLNGIDLKTNAGYVMLPPSVHPDTSGLYRWENVEAPIEPMPQGLVALLRPDLDCVQARRTRPLAPHLLGPNGSIADAFCSAHIWAQILEPAGWHCVAGDGEQDGSRWRHPAATAQASATIKYGLLFVYSENTPFVATTAGDPHGYTKFRAWATLEHHGDLSAAARACRVSELLRVGGIA